MQLDLGAEELGFAAKFSLRFSLPKLASLHKVLSPFPGLLQCANQEQAHIATTTV